jgi:phosphohistidine phosphatase
MILKQPSPIEFLASISIKMTKKLILMRHGEAEIGAGYQKDFDRKLGATGIYRLQRLNKVLVERDFSFDLIIKSPSRRTMETAKIIAENLIVMEAHVMDSIYESSVDNLLDIIQGLPDQYEQVIVIGHNPSLTALLAYLTGDFHLSLSPGMMAVLSFDLPEWKMLSKGTGYLNEVLQ